LVVLLSRERQEHDGMHGGVFPRGHIFVWNNLPAADAAFYLLAEPVDLLGEVGYDPTMSNLYQQPTPIQHPRWTY
jgi:hypothetical protein